MRKSLNRLLLLIAALLLVIASVVGIATYLIDPNDFKPQIIAFAKEKTGRDLEIPGDIALSFFPWVGISTGQIVLKNSPDFQDKPFATIEQSDIRVKLMSLLAKRIQVSTIVLKGLNLNLVKNKQGIWNWDDLLPKKKDKTESAEMLEKKPKASIAESSSRKLTDLAINGIVVERAHIDWDNQQSGKRIELTELNLKTDAFTFERPVALHLSFLMGNKESKPSAAVSLISNLNVPARLNSIELTGLDLNYTRKDSVASVQPLPVHLAAANLAFDLKSQSLKLADLQLNYGDLNLSANLNGKQIIDAPAIEGPVNIKPFNPARLMKQMNVAVPEMQDKNAFSELKGQFNLLASAESLDIKQLAGQLDETSIRGSGAIKGFAQPAINFEVILDTIDADRYLPAKMKSDKPLATPAVALAAGLSKMPADMLKNLNVNGDVLLDHLKINGLSMHGLHFILSGNHEQVTVRQSIRKMYQGTYHGDVSLKHSERQTNLSFNERIDQLQLEPLFKDWRGKAKIRGVVQASAHLQGQGRNFKEIKSGLTGQFNFLLKEAAIKGFNLQKIIDGLLDKNKGKVLSVVAENDQTIFSEIVGTANLNGGVVQNRDLIGRSSRFRVEGAGSANLNTDALDYKLTTKVVKKQAAPTESEQFHSTPVVIRIGGTFDQPSYSLDVSALLTEKNKAKIDKLLDKKKEKIDKLLDKLDKKLGPGTGDLLKKIF